MTLRKSTETCYVFKKGNVRAFVKYYKSHDLVEAMVTKESQKPTEMYDNIWKLVPDGHVIEVFARQNNIHANVVSVGNQLRSPNE